MKPPRFGAMSSAELVAAVAAAGLDDYDDGLLAFPQELRPALREEHRVKLRAFLADLDSDPLDYIRARRDVKLADPDDYAGGHHE
jgi:hypothetical protein